MERVRSPRTHASLTRNLLLKHDRPCAARRTAHAVTQSAQIDLELRERAAQRIAVHAQLASGLALIAIVLFKNGDDESLLEFAHRFGVENAAFLHLQNESF